RLSPNELDVHHRRRATCGQNKYLFLPELTLFDQREKKAGFNFISNFRLSQAVLLVFASRRSEIFDDKNLSFQRFSLQVTDALHETTFDEINSASKKN
ncbi:MAG: hypothetical protein LBR08_09295, partial [Bacteroidales bacterium]|nr:hypothetical protein [Bacteroidales bacterium]